MTWFEWLAQALVIGLLGWGVPVAWRLQASLARLRAERAAMEAGAEGLADATRAAEAALLRLRATAELAGRGVAERVAVAEPLREDLRYLIERAETLADRLESGVRAARPLAQDAAPAAAPVREPRSAAERSLLQALAGRA